MRIGIPGGGASALGGWVSASYIWTGAAEKQPGRFAEAPEKETNSAANVFLMGLRRPAANPPRLPGDTPVFRTGRTEKTWTH
jgi:hypothetical protein